MRYAWWSAIDRFWLHIPVGLVIIGLTWLHWAAGLGYVALFVFYESNEDQHVKDQAWKDVAGAMFGMMLGGATWAILDWRL